jgi:integrase
MNTVEPIRDIDTVNDIADELKAQNERDYVLFMAGIYSGSRISDLLKLRVKDVRNKERIYVREEKTGKERVYPINNHLKKIFKEYIQSMEDWQYLFPSRKGSNKPITRIRAYGILNTAAAKFGLEHIGTHTLRKTFGYHFHLTYPKKTAELQKILNHSSERVTLIYIGIEQEETDKLIKGLSFKRGSRI